MNQSRRHKTKSWHNASHIQQPSVADGEQITDAVNPLWTQPPIVPFEVTEPRGPNILSPSPMTRRFQKTFPNTETVKIQRKPRRVRIMLDEDYEARRREKSFFLRPRKPASPLYESILTANQEERAPVQTYHGWTSSAAAKQSSQPDKRRSSVGSSSQDLNDFESEMSSVLGDVQSPVSIVTRDQKFARGNVQLNLNTEVVGNDSTVDKTQKGPSLTVTKEKDEALLGPPADIRAKKSHYTLGDIFPSSFYDNFLHYLTEDSATSKQDADALAKSSAPPVSEAIELELPRYKSNYVPTFVLNNEQKSEKNSTVNEESAKFGNKLETAPSFFESPPIELDPFAQLRQPRRRLDSCLARNFDNSKYCYFESVYS